MVNVGGFLGFRTYSAWRAYLPSTPSRNHHCRFYFLSFPSISTFRLAKSETLRQPRVVLGQLRFFRSSCAFWSAKLLCVAGFIVDKPGIFKANWNTVKRKGWCRVLMSESEVRMFTDIGGQHLKLEAAAHFHRESRVDKIIFGRHR